MYYLGVSYKFHTKRSKLFKLHQRGVYNSVIVYHHKMNFCKFLLLCTRTHLFNNCILFSIVFCIINGSLLVLIKYVLTIDVICLKENDGTMFPNADNVAWYFECKNESLLMKICPDWNVFDADLKECILNEPEIVPSIEEDLLQLPITESTEWSVSTKVPTMHISTDTLNTEEPSADLIEEEVRCPCYDTASPTYYASSRQCDKYFLCYRSRPLELSCCRGQHWNQRLKKCIPEHFSECGITPVAAVSLIPDCPHYGCAFYPHPTVCEYFYYCENGVRSIQQCDAFYHWDFYSQRCLIQSQARCITSIPLELRRNFYK